MSSKFVSVEFVAANTNVTFRFDEADTTYEVFYDGSSGHVQTTLGFADEGLTLQLLRTGTSTVDLTATLRNGDTQIIPITLLAQVDQLAGVTFFLEIIFF